MKKKEINYQLLIRRICLIVLDIICIIAASILALLTRFEFDFSQIPKEFLTDGRYVEAQRSVTISPIRSEQSLCCHRRKKIVSAV